MVNRRFRCETWTAGRFKQHSHSLTVCYYRILHSCSSMHVLSAPYVHVSGYAPCVHATILCILTCYDNYGWSKWAGPLVWNILHEIIVALHVSMRVDRSGERGDCRHRACRNSCDNRWYGLD